jgi:phosphoribosyl-AMP cyclohydrolase / phosphoribosyl-ATP pyrophosphohydrolase
MTTKEIDALKFDGNGLLPAIVQDASSGEVLMLAYMSRESLSKTMESGETHFWSRTRNELWHKGATSGHTQKVVSIGTDCDEDALLVRVHQAGAACHTGAYSCFAQAGQEKESISLTEVLGQLARTIKQRNLERPQGSYTTKLLDGGIDRILKKIGEEAGEVIIASKNHNRQEILWEVSDLLYHLLVMLEHEQITMDEVGKELRGRFADKK